MQMVLKVRKGFKVLMVLMELWVLKAQDLRVHKVHKDFKVSMGLWDHRVLVLKERKGIQGLKVFKALKAFKVTLVLKDHKDFKDRRGLLAVRDPRVIQDQWVHKELDLKDLKVDKDLVDQRDHKVHKGFKVHKDL